MRVTASRGLRVGLVEARDLASGTSSRSSKLIHGGLRYLEQLDFKLVSEALRERDLLISLIAPHLVKPVSFLYPLHRKVLERPYVGAGLVLYDAMNVAKKRVPGSSRRNRSSGRAERTPSICAYERHAYDNVGTDRTQGIEDRIRSNGIARAEWPVATAVR